MMCHDEMMYHVLIRTLSSNLVWFSMLDIAPAECSVDADGLDGLDGLDLRLQVIKDHGDPAPKLREVRDPETPRPRDPKTKVTTCDHTVCQYVAMIHETHGVTYLCTRSSTYARKVQENNRKNDHIKYTVIYLIALISHWIHIHIC